MDYLTDLESTCAALGTNDGAGSYHKDDDCLECVKDLIRFLRRDDGNNHTLRQALGQIGVVKSDLLPILREYSSDDDLFDMVLRLVVNLTSPELLLFRQELPEDKLTRNYFLNLQRYRQGYKEACIDEKLWRILGEKLGALLQKEFDERSEDDRLIIERILILVRNILEIPRDSSSEKRTEDDATVHDQILWVFHKSGMEDLLLYIASSSDEAQYCLHVLEIISLMFREQDPKFLASANFQRSKEERKEDEAALIRLRKEEEEKKKQKYFQVKSLRHSRFGGSYTLTNMKSISENPIIYHKPLSTLNNINFDENKRHKKISKNRETPKDECKRRSTLAIRLFLKEFCIEFLNGAYNQLMYVVKDNLNRQKAQQNDETYYLWAIKFFMEFNRVHKFRVELVTETMSKATFHYIHQQMEAYKDNYEHEKRNRPMCLTWARRMHLALKAYQELLHNLVAMGQSQEESVRQSSVILRSDVFYEPEYRELCLQQLSIYNETKMSISYLKDLAETTHIFLKLMESMSKGKNILISSKSKRKPASLKKSNKPIAESKEMTIKDKNETIWEAMSSQLSECVQGNVNIPTNISPFDAASDTPIDDQKDLAMIRIQDFIRNSKSGKAVALLRAAREVWPENETFGPSDADAEDEFMALREILFADISRKDFNLETESESPEETNPGDNLGETEIDEEDEEEYEDVTYSVEHEFSFKALAVRFAVKNVCSMYGLLLNNYQRNSPFTNHCIVKMLHRIAWDCGMPAMIFNVCYFKSFKQIHKEYSDYKVDALKELDRFGKFILTRFFEVCKSNKKVFMETLFWKTNREASEILDGYSNETMSKRSQAAIWTEEEEAILQRTFHQLKESQESIETEGRSGHEDILDSIITNLEDSGKNRRQIVKKMKELELISDISEITSDKSKASFWSARDKELLQQIFHNIESERRAESSLSLNEDKTVLEQICDEFKDKGKSKRQIIKMLKELGLIHDQKEIGSYKERSSIWNKEDTDKIQRIFTEIKEFTDVENLSSMNENVLIDSMVHHFADSGKNKRQIVKRLKDMNLIKGKKGVGNNHKKSTKSKSSESSSENDSSENENDSSENENDSSDDDREKQQFVRSSMSKQKKNSISSDEDENVVTLGSKHKSKAIAEDGRETAFKSRKKKVRPHVSPQHTTERESSNYSHSTIQTRVLPVINSNSDDDNSVQNKFEHTLSKSNKKLAISSDDENEVLISSKSKKNSSDDDNILQNKLEIPMSKISQKRAISSDEDENKVLIRSTSKKKRMLIDSSDED